MGIHAKPAGHRVHLLEAAVRFAQAVAQLRGVRQISLLGSITTDRPNPKDIDLLVAISDEADVAALAASARRLKGTAQQVNLGADVFLADDRGNYLGRTCHWKDCRPGVRVACDALNCGRRPHLHDDLGTLRLSPETVQAPPITFWPVVVRRCAVPEDVEHMLAQFDTPSNRPLLAVAIPALAAELRHLLEAQALTELAQTIDHLRLLSRCHCSDDFCATFYTGPWPAVGTER